MIKKITRLTILSFALNPFSACIALPNSVQNEIYIPRSQAANAYSASLVVLRPGGSNDYAVLVSPFNPDVASPILSPSWEPKGISPHFHPGFTLNFRHEFANTGNDVNFSWIRLHTRNQHTFPVNREPPPGQQFAGPFWNIGPDAGTTSTANGELTNKYDVVSAEFGKKIALAEVQTRLFAGISGLWLKQKIEGDFSGVDPILSDYLFFIRSKSKFNAVGMRFGMEGEYSTWCRLSAVGMIAGSLFVGNQQPITETYGAGTILTAAGMASNYQTINHKRYIQTIPALDGKLGIKYTSKYKEKFWSVEAGYMTSIFINAIQSYVPSTYVPGSLGIVSGSIYLQGLMKTTESFSVDGPYLTVTLKM